MDPKETDAALDAPFVPDAPDGDTGIKTKIEEPEAEPVKPETPVEEDKAKIPYSRFENVNRARREAEQEAERWRQRALELEENRFQSKPPVQEGVPSWWTRLYGDTEQTREAWNLYRENQPSLDPQAIREEAVRAYREEQEREQQTFQSNLATIDDGLEALSEYLGRPISEAEQSDLLDIVDEYTPKDDIGNYLGAPISFDKAWDIYEMKSKNASAPRKQSRDAVARATSSGSSGQPSSEQQERDKNYRSGVWGQWRERFKGQE